MSSFRRLPTVAPPPSPDSYCAAVRAALLPLADAARAAQMRAYLRQQFPFLGLPAPTRRQAVRPLLPLLASAPAEHLLAVAEALWDQPQREYQAVAIDLLAHHWRTLHEPHVPALLQLAQRKAWWDSVDGLAGVVGDVLRRHQLHTPGPLAVMEQAVGAPCRWVRRIAMLHQLGWRAATDAPRLWAFARQLAPESDFFIRKAIGWALRDYARHDPAAVAAFLAEVKPHLAPLTYREASRHLSILPPNL